MNLYESIKEGSKPNLVYVKDCRVDIDSVGNATVWKDGKILTQFKVPESIKPEEYREYLEYKLEDEDEYDYKSKHFNESSLDSAYSNVIRTIDDACSEEMDENQIQLCLQNIIDYCRTLATEYNVIVESADYQKILTETDSKELDSIANWLYKYDVDDWDKFTDEELLTLAKLCQISDDNPYGRAYDDEVFDELNKRNLKLEEAANQDNKEANELIGKALDNYKFAIEHEKELNDLGIRVDVTYYGDNNNIQTVHLTGKNGRKLKCSKADTQIKEKLQAIHNKLQASKEQGGK